MNRFTRIALTASAFALLSVAAPAQQPDSNPAARKLAVEFVGEKHFGDQAYVSENPSEPSLMETSPPPRLPGWTDKPGAIPLTRVRLRFSYEGDAVRMKVAAVFDDSEPADAPGPKYGAKEKEIASYLAREGETVSVAELKRYGFEPLALKVVEARARPEEPLLAARPAVGNDHKSIEVVSFTNVESRPNSYKLRLRNVSPKAITALELYDDDPGGRSGQTAHGSPSNPVIRPGGEYETEFNFSIGGRMTPQGYVSDETRQRTLVVGTVVFDDGTYEGGVETVANLAASQKGQRIQLARAAALVQDILNAPDLNEADAVAKLKDEVGSLRIDVEPSVVAELLAQFPELPQSKDNVKRLNMEVMNGLKNGRQTVLFQIRELEDALARGPGSFTLRQRLAFIKEEVERLGRAR